MENATRDDTAALIASNIPRAFVRALLAEKASEIVFEIILEFRFGCRMFLYG